MEHRAQPGNLGAAELREQLTIDNGELTADSGQRTADGGQLSIVNCQLSILNHPTNGKEQGKTMKQFTKQSILPLILIAALAGLTVGLPILDYALAQGSTEAGNISARSYTAGVTAGRFVKFTTAGVITTATAQSDSIVGICRTTAASGKLTSYAPVGSATTVTSGEAIAVGDLLTAGTLGKAFVLDPSRALPQRIAAVALDAAAAADSSIRVLVVAASTAGFDSSPTAITGNTTLDANSTGTTYTVTADAVITLPSTAIGVTYTFINAGLDAAVLITLSPASADLIRGQGYAGAANTDHINTKTTAKKGDYCTIVGDGSLGWYIQRQSGTWTHQ
jgi:hypothetical protein